MDSSVLQKLSSPQQNQYPAAARATNVSQLAVGPGAALALGVAQTDLEPAVLGDEGYRMCSVDHTGSLSPVQIPCGGAAGPNGFPAGL